MAIVDIEASLSPDADMTAGLSAVFAAATSLSPDASVTAGLSQTYAVALTLSGETTLTPTPTLFLALPPRRFPLSVPQPGQAHVAEPPPPKYQILPNPRRR